jgi:hypothetical protein
MTLSALPPLARSPCIVRDAAEGTAALYKGAVISPALTLALPAGGTTDYFSLEKAHTAPATSGRDSRRRGIKDSAASVTSLFTVLHRLSSGGRRSKAAKDSSPGSKKEPQGSRHSRRQDWRVPKPIDPQMNAMFEVWSGWHTEADLDDRSLWGGVSPMASRAPSVYEDCL